MKNIKTIIITATLSTILGAGVSSLVFSKQFNGKVEASIIANPDVILEALRIIKIREEKASNKLQQTSITEALSNLDSVKDVRISQGASNPNTTIYEFVDFNCSYCKKAHSEKKLILSKYPDVEIKTIIFPILGNDSEVASKLALYALNKFGNDTAIKVFNAIIEKQRPINKENVLSIMMNIDPLVAEDIKNNFDVIISDIKLAQKIRENKSLAHKLNITGTPSYIIGGAVKSGYIPLEKLSSLLESLK